MFNKSEEYFPHTLQDITIILQGQSYQYLFSSLNIIFKIFKKGLEDY